MRQPILERVMMTRTEHALTVSEFPASTGDCPKDLGKIKRSIALISVVALGLVGSSSFAPIHAESFPSNAIRIVVPTPPGTPPDIISRVVASHLSEREGWRMVVENRPGGLQTVAMLDVLRQPADGHTIYPMSVPTATVPALMPQLGVR